MKKFLSLMLAMIMVMSLVTVGAGAAFTDAAEITNTEAVEVMNALGILQGSDGAFDPTGTLTRGAAAKIITYMLVGTDKAEAIAAAGLDEKPFPDVPTTSATAPFIAYCAEKGIVGGYSDGTFQRSNPVSGNAFLKMVLVALGVKDIDFTAKGWQVEAVAKAEEMELLEGIADDVLFSSNLTRENAAQIAFNGMKYVPEGNKYYVVNGVEFEDISEAAIYAMSQNNATIEQVTDLTKSLAGKNYKLAVIEEYMITATPETADQDYTDAIDFYGVEDDVKLAAVVSKELVGHVVNIYYEDKDADGKYDWSATEGKSEKVYAVVALSEEVKTSTTNGLKVDAVNELLGTDYDKTEVPDATGEVKKTAYSVVGNVITDTEATFLEYKVKPTYTGITVKSGTWIVYDEVVLAKKSASSDVEAFEVTVDEDGYITVEKDGTPVYVTAEDEDDCVDLIANEYDWASVVEEADEPVEVLLTTKYAGVYMTVADPATVTGKVTKVDTSGDTDYIYIDGTKYQGNTGVAEATAFELTQFAWNYSFSYTAEYVFYLDSSNKVFAFERADGVTEGTLIVPTLVFGKYEYVANQYDEYGVADEDLASTYSIWLQAVDMNGKMVTLQLTPSEKIDAVYAVSESAVVAIKDAAVDAYVAGFGANFATYTTSIDAETDEEIATVVDAVAAGTANKIEGWSVVKTASANGLTASSKKVEDDNGNAYYLNNSFKVIYIDGTGSDLEVSVKDGTYGQIVEGALLYGEKAAKADDSYALKYVLVIDNNESAGTSDDLMYIKSVSSSIAVPYTNKDGKVVTGYQNTGYVNGEKVTILLTGAQAKDDATKLAGNKFYTYKVNEDGTYTLSTPKKAVNVVENEALDGNYKGLITVVNADKQINVADYDATDAKIVNLVSSSNMGYDDVPTKASKLEVTGTNVSFVYDKSTETISVIYVIAYADQDK